MGIKVARLSYDTTETLIYDPVAANRTATRAALYNLGFRRLETVGTLDGLAECIRRRPPDLILCDYRLPGKESGIDVIQRIRGEYNEEIPAILITGDTAPERLQEAHDSGLVVLSKPVANSKLRATIGNVTKRRPPVSPEAADAF